VKKDQALPLGTATGTDWRARWVLRRRPGSVGWGRVAIYSGEQRSGPGLAVPCASVLTPGVADQLGGKALWKIDCPGAGAA